MLSLVSPVKDRVDNPQLPLVILELTWVEQPRVPVDNLKRLLLIRSLNWAEEQ